MRITKWNIFHAYTSSIVGRTPDLQKWAKAVVQAGIGAVAVHRDGECWYRSRGQVKSASTQLGFLPYRAEGAFTIPGDASDYAKECMLQAASMRTHEQYVLADPLNHLPSYIRVFFEPSVLAFDAITVKIYPTAKIFEDGVLIIELRVLSSEQEYEDKAFIQEQVNLYSHQVIACELPLEILTRASGYGFCTDGWLFWPGVHRKQRELRRVLRPLLTSEDDGDFFFRRVSLSEEYWQALIASGLAPINLRELARLHEWALLDVAASANKSKFALIRTSGEVRAGHYWSGRPSVYIVETRPPLENSKQLLNDHAESIARILTRSVGAFREHPESIIGPNLRQFEDYAVFANKAITLWVGLRGAHDPPLTRSGEPVFTDRNHGDFIYTKQVQIEFVEYWYLAHKIVEELSREPAHKLSDLALMERQLVALDRSVDEIPPSGEIADLIRHIGSELKIARIADQVRANLRYREVVMQEERDRRNTAFGIVFASLFGLTGAPALADSFVKPTLEFFKWKRPHDDILWSLECLGIASALLLGLVSLAAAFFFYRRRRWP